MAEMIDPNQSSSQGSNPDPNQSEQQPRIVVDSDWKEQAQAEKERLAQQEQQTGQQKAEQGQMPEADFRGLVGSLATQAVMYLGGIPDPDGRAIVAPEYARHYIDLLGVLEEKTKGNLTQEESQELTGVLQELRTRFVQIVRSVAAQQQQQGQGQTPPQTGPGGQTGPGQAPSFSG